MMLREVKLTDAALYDLYDLDYTIRQEFQAPLTAERYLTGLKKQIQTLSRTADLGVVQSNLSLQYGKAIRRENYKKMTPPSVMPWSSWGRKICSLTARETGETS